MPKTLDRRDAWSLLRNAGGTGYSWHTAVAKIGEKNQNATLHGSGKEGPTWGEVSFREHRTDGEKKNPKLRNNA